VILLFSRNYSFFSQNPRTAPTDAVSRRPPEAAIPIKWDKMTAAYDMSQFSAIISLDQVELFPNQGHIFNSVEVRNQGTSQYPVMIVIADEGKNLTKYLIQSK
jgi:hypothetical protein